MAEKKDKLVVRKAIEGDRRANLVSITDEGKQLFKDVIPIIMEFYEYAVSCITQKEVEITLNTLKKIIAHLSKN